MGGDETSVRDRVLRLLSDYCRFVDERQAAAWQGLFVDGGRLVYGDAVTQGVDGLRAFVDGSPQGTHLTGLPAIETGDGKVISAHTPFTFVRTDGTQLIAGYYHDQLVDEGDRVRFQERRVQLNTRVLLPTPSDT